jgi:phosphoribosylformylglycinamidine cyclo-ligase
VEGRTYEAAGVSLAAAESVVDRLRAAAESTGASGLGAFAGLYPLDDGRLLAASTDGVGTKLILARALVGGETAELPGIYRDDELDFAGTCVGIVERDRVIDGTRIREGDALIGFPSSGLHANGFTLVRRVLQEDDYDGDDLLAPTRLYMDEVRALREVHGLAHVTGGGIAGNLERIVPNGLRAEIDWDGWERPPVFEWLGRYVEEDELRRVFNLGIGYCAVVPDAGDSLVIGRIVAS